MTRILQHLNSTNLIIDRGIGSYPALIKPKFNELNGTEEFQIDILIPKITDLSMLYAVVTRVIEEEWGSNVPHFKYSWIKDGDVSVDAEGNDKEGYPGHWFITPKSTVDQPPIVVDLAGNELTRLDSIVGGDIIDAFISCFAYNKKVNKGVSFGLNTVRLREKADIPLGGGVSRVVAKAALAELDVDFQV